MTQGRLHGLDALRGVAACWVLLYHDTLRYPRFMAGLEMDVSLFAGFEQAELGIMPVLWFFLISGFVIAMTVDRCRAMPVGRWRAMPVGRWRSGWDFVVRRASRIYPAYWAALALTTATIVMAPLPGGFVTGPQLLANLTMAQSYLGHPDIDGVYWSLGVELLFYAYALAAILAGRRLVAPVVFAWALACCGAALAVRLGQPVSWQLSRLLLLTYGPLLAGGMMIHRLCQSPARSPRWSVATLALCAAATALRFHPVTAATCFAAAALIAVAARRPRWLARWGAPRPLVALGAISYALYLSHEIIGFTLIAALDARGLPHPVGVAAAVALSLLVATAITLLVERPAMAAVRARLRTPPDPGGPGGPPATAATAAPGRRTPG